MIKEDINPVNNKNQRHGYWEVYYNNHISSFKGRYINGERIGLWEWYDRDEIYQKEFIIL